MRILLACLLAFTSHAQPDTLVLNATVYTVDEGFATAEAFAIDNGAFALVGTNREVRAIAGDTTRVIDLGGAVVLPGLIDAHGHMAGLGQLEVGVIDLAGTTSYTQVIERVAERASAIQPGTWILGHGWDHESWPERELPHHRELSDAVPDHPVSLSRVDGHATLANEHAMRTAGVSESSESPAGGLIVRGESGEPTGVFVDAAEALVTHAIPDEAQGDPRAMLLAAQRLCLAAGLTGVHDAGVDPSMTQLYKQLEASGELSIRITGMMSLVYAAKWFEQNEPYRGERFSMAACKAYADGAMGSRGAWLLEPYADKPTGDDGAPYTGLAVTDPADIERAAKHARQHGYQLCTHAIGDRANREILNAYETALRDDYVGVADGHITSNISDGQVESNEFPGRLIRQDRRFRIEHAQLLAPADIPRFAALGIIASMQPTHCTSDMRWIEDRVGVERAAGAYAWRSLLDTGAVVAGGSDFPVESHNPFLGLYAAVTRQNLAGEPAGGWRPEERMTREEAIRSMTIDAAYASFDEHRLGSIEPGKRADFIVIDRDIVIGHAEDIPGTIVLETWIDGERVYRR